MIRASVKRMLPLFSVFLGILPTWAQKSVPVAGTGGNYTLTSGSSVLTAGPGRAGRIRSLKYNGVEILYVDSSGNNNNWGSTSWPSPQAYWSAPCKATVPPNYLCGPPPVAIDAATTVYTGGFLAADTVLTYAGGPDTAVQKSGTAGGGTGVRLRKTYWANPADSSFSQRYTLANAVNVPITFAPWEITRFVSGGLSFYPVSADTVRGTLALRNMTKDTLGVRWFTYDSTNMTTTGTSKILADGTGGWYAHVDKSRILFIKKFYDTPLAKGAPFNTNEAECELYAANRTGTAGGMAYQEMELQGPFDTIGVHDSINWTVKWLVRKLPDSISIGRNSSLLNFVARMMNSSLPVDSTSFLPVSLYGAFHLPFFSMDYSGGLVRLSLNRTSALSLFLADARGREVCQIHTGSIPGGHHDFSLPSSLPKGVYWLILKSPDVSQILSSKMLVRF